mmetsp:Transcript_43244/g.109651  ORF Transcript_43244/g.109651 Transcript_43244/m.109651 type:complete len:283 (-) Transcript_43244:279-1127(-)
MGCGRSRPNVQQATIVPPPTQGPGKNEPWVQAGISQETYDHLLTEFVMLDENADQKLSRKEFDNVNGLPEYLGMQSEDIADLFKTVDVDHNGSISLIEFVTHMSKRKDHHPLPIQVDPQKKRLEAAMQQFGFCLCLTEGGRQGVCGDGNCQFYSLSWEMHKTTQKYAELREKLIAYMRGPARESYSVFYAPTHHNQPASFDGYLDMMAKDRTWGDHLTLQAAAALFNLEVRVLTADRFSQGEKPFLTLSSEKTGCKVIWISFVAQHYSPIEPSTKTPADLLK